MCAIVISALAAQPARAGNSEIVLPLYDVPPATHASAARGVDQADATQRSLNATRSSSAEIPRPTASFALVEMPADVALPGSGYKRPHHALGYRWQAAEYWLRDHGFDAQTCFMPMMRLHTNLSASGASGTLWLYGRCTFR
jgi:hypothetical protein